MSEKCGCEIDYGEEEAEDGSLRIFNGTIIYCPLHAHAEELFTELTRAMDCLRGEAKNNLMWRSSVEELLAKSTTSEAKTPRGMK